MRGQAQWPCCLGCPLVVARLNAADAAWAVAGGAEAKCGGWGDGAEAAQKQRQPLLQPIPQICSNGPTVRILCKQVINPPKSRSKCEIRIWFRRPSAARSKCRKFEFNVSARYVGGARQIALSTETEGSQGGHNRGIRGAQLSTPGRARARRREPRLSLQRRDGIASQGAA
jgi:hypothetical protein